MSEKRKTVVIEDGGKKPRKDRFPTIVAFIILAEFCERFSYSGMRAFLTLYLRSKLGYSDDGATETYHIFSTLVYVFPFVGGIVADNYLGKYRTILYMMFVYAAGNALVAITAIPQLGLPARLCTLLGLFMITVGTGGIKPCVTAFGGDQFKLPEQENHLAMYFSILYFNLCMGSLIAKTISPILRSEVHCFGEKDCYSLAFGAPGLIVLVSVVIFVSAKSRYVLKKPEGNVVLDFTSCVALGIRNTLIGSSKREKGSHWLDTTEHKYDKRFIKDIKKTLSILTLFSVLPVFWALLDQMGSRWTLQAAKMDGRLGYITIKPDQMQVLNPIGILILIPLAQKYIYPYLEKRNILKNPLHKLTLGGVLAGLAFIASGVVEIYLRTTYPHLPHQGYSQLRIFNGNNCSVSLQSVPYNITYTLPPLSQFTKRDIKINNTEYISIELGGSCIEPKKEMFLLEESKAVSFFLDGDSVHRFEDNVDKSRSGLPVVRFLLTSRVLQNVTLIKGNMVESHISGRVSPQMEVFSGKYDLFAGNDFVDSGIEMLSGGVYTILVDDGRSQYKSSFLVLTEANSISMAFLLPQFLIMSTAEVLFAVTGNEFAFKEAPDSMKAVMSAVWMLTNAVGNVIIIAVTRMLAGYRQDSQFFFYTGLMFVSISVFHWMSRGYKFRHEDEPPRKERRSNSEILYLQVKQAEDCLDH
ncbi:peptide transporter family 1-like [Ostrinia nubilalis]|uniref:peptide transporter family 1-like n=1 Tax=Ostrinia nubilalis TaxID=29057 RepID=UPI003082596B